MSLVDVRALYERRYNSTVADQQKEPGYGKSDSYQTKIVGRQHSGKNQKTNKEQAFHTAELDGLPQQRRPCQLAQLYFQRTLPFSVMTSEQLIA